MLKPKHASVGHPCLVNHRAQLHIQHKQFFTMTPSNTSGGPISLPLVAMTLSLKQKAQYGHMAVLPVRNAGQTSLAIARHVHCNEQNNVQPLHGGRKTAYRPNPHRFASEVLAKVCRGVCRSKWSPWAAQGDPMAVHCTKHKVTFCPDPKADTSCQLLKQNYGPSRVTRA